MEPRSQHLGLKNAYLENYRNGRLPSLVDLTEKFPPTTVEELAEVVMLDISKSWECGAPRTVQFYLEKFPGLTADRSVLLRLVEHEYQVLHEHGQNPELDSFVMQFPELSDQDKDQLLQTRKLVTGQGPYYERGVTLPTAEEQLILTDSLKTPKQIGRYEIRGKLGSGQFGIVYLAFDPKLAREVAIKVPLNGHFSQEQLAAFEREAQNLAQLSHPNIVAIYDFGETEEGSCYLVSQFIEGESLQSILRKRQLGRDEAIALLASVAEGLQAAHQRKIIHRDIKPANILVNLQGSPFITDFGLSLRTEQKSPEECRVDGSPAYMSPEQTMGKLDQLDGRSDIWSLGVVMYELLAGARPFRSGKVQDLFDLIRNSEPRSLRSRKPDIPADLEQICLGCLSKRVTDRYQTADDLAQALRQQLAPRKLERQTNLFRVATVFPLESEPFPLWGCTLVNQSQDPLIVNKLNLELLEFKAVRGASQSKLLAPIATLDVTLPLQPGNYPQDVPYPIMLAPRDAATVAIRLSCRDANGVIQSPADLGGFRFRLTFGTDGLEQATTDELRIGRI